MQIDILVGLKRGRILLTSLLVGAAIQELKQILGRAKQDYYSLPASPYSFLFDPFITLY